MSLQKPTNISPQLALVSEQSLSGISAIFENYVQVQLWRPWTFDDSNSLQFFFHNSVYMKKFSGKKQKLTSTLHVVKVRRGSNFKKIAKTKKIKYLFAFIQNMFFLFFVPELFRTPCLTKKPTYSKKMYSHSIEIRV